VGFKTTRRRSRLASGNYFQASGLRKAPKGRLIMDTRLKLGVSVGL